MSLKTSLCVAAIAASLVGSAALADDPVNVDKEARIEVGGEDRYLRLFFWSQFWVQFNQNNPGTVVRGTDEKDTTNFGLRRTRVVLFGQAAPRIRALLHLGINNQSTSNGGVKPQIFFHEVAGEVEAVKNWFFVGGGIHFWNGPTRLSSASTATFLGLDAPLWNFPEIDTVDQFARQLGVYGKGKMFDRLDYRVSFNQPFTFNGVPGENKADFNPKANSRVFQGYVKWDFLDIESNVLPYMTGTYLGKKRVFNVGGGWNWSPKEMAFLQQGSLVKADILQLAVDAFLDLPLKHRSDALTVYAAAIRYDFGPNYLRSIGGMNPSATLDTTVKTSVNGPGNGVPIVGTGNLYFAQAGYLLPDWFGAAGRLQPYASLGVYYFKALEAPVILPDVGINYLVVGHHAKLTVNYRNRPIYMAQADGKPTVAAHANEVTAQAQFSF